MKGMLLIYALGFLSQVLFFGRVVIQWFMSEKEGKVISPTIFWQLSLFGSLLMLVYGILRNDFAIILGQLIVYFVYVRNLQLKGAWKESSIWFKIFVIGAPLVAFIWLFGGSSHNWKAIMQHPNIPVWLLVLGTLGQVIFNFRFIYQWIYSENKKESVLPIGFWIISVVGAVLIFVYGLFRKDPVLILGQGFSLILYARNLMLLLNIQSVFVNTLIQKTVGVVDRALKKK